MKKLILSLLVFFSFSYSNAQSYLRDYSSDLNPWASFALGVGYSHFSNSSFNKDYQQDFKSECIDVCALFFGVYLDGEFSVESNHYDELSVAGMNFGYLFPVVTTNDFRMWLGPIMGYNKIYDRHDRYYYHDYPLDSYFNFGGVLGMSIKHVYLQGKFSRTQIGVALGYSF